MEFLRFIFSSFWVWAGLIVLIALIGSCTTELVKTCKRNRKVTVEKVGVSVRTIIENATEGEAQNAIASASYTQHGEEKSNG